MTPSNRRMTRSSKLNDTNARAAIAKQQAEEATQRSQEEVQLAKEALQQAQEAAQWPRRNTSGQEAAQIAEEKALQVEEHATQNQSGLRRRLQKLRNNSISIKASTESQTESRSYKSPKTPIKKKPRLCKPPSKSYNPNEIGHYPTQKLNVPWSPRAKNKRQLVGRVLG